MAIKRKIEIYFHITPAELAAVFANYDEKEQALFFNEIAKQVDQWDCPFCFQTQSITDSEKLTDEGRQIMQIIGEYSQQNV